MAAKKHEQREHARLLYVNERITLKEVAERVNVSEKTIGKWCREDSWDKLRKALLTTREAQLTHWYNQLEAVNTDIALRSPIYDDKGNPIRRPPKFIPTSAEADIMSKTTANIKSLEVEIGLGEIVETGKQLITFIQKVSLEDAKVFKNYFDEYINERLKNG